MAVQALESEETYGERFAYLSGDCDLGEGLDELDDWDRTMVAHRAYSDIDSALVARLLVGIADLDNLSVPFWAGKVAVARDSLIAHEQAWVDLLEDEMRLASQMSNEGSLDDRQELIQDLADLRELASPSNLRDLGNRRAPIQRCRELRGGRGTDRKPLCRYRTGLLRIRTGDRPMELVEQRFCHRLPA